MPLLPKPRSTRLALLLSTLLVAVACSKDQSDKAADKPEPVSAAPILNQLPKLELKDSTANLLLTWIDKKGDFHVVQKPEEVPDEGRTQVRVVVTTREAGTGRLVYVANLSKKNADETYPVMTMTRAQWNELGAERRKVRIDALTPAPKPSAEADKSEEKPGKQKGKKVRAVVYGASWCKPCHEAEKFLKGLGVDVDKKDIERSQSARAEMNAKLSRIGRFGASIPIIDVAGEIFVGFSKSALKRAVEKARRPETL